MSEVENDPNKEDDYLLRWLTGDLSASERAQLKNKDDYEEMETNRGPQPGRADPNVFQQKTSPLLWVLIVLVAIAFYYFVF